MANYVGDDSYALTTLVASGAVSTAMSKDGSRVYVATSTGHVEVYDTATGAKIADWTLAGVPGAISLSDDGSFLLVTVPGGDAESAGLLVRIATDDGSTTEYRTSTSLYDVEVVDGDTALVTGVATLSVDLADGTFTAIGGLPAMTGYEPVLVEDGNLTILAETNSSSGSLQLYDDRTGLIFADGDNYADGLSLGYNWGTQAISEEAGLIVQFSYYSGLNLYDLQLNAIEWIPIESPATGAVFSADGKYLYLLLPTQGEVVQYLVADWSVVERFAVSPGTWTNRIGYGDNLVISDDGNFLTVMDKAGNGYLQLIDISGRNETFLGTIADDRMEGRLGDDTYRVNTAGDVVIEGLDAGNDTIKLYNLTTYVMPRYVENLITYSTASLYLTGNSSHNTIFGNEAADVIAGMTGNDTLYGRDGDDLLDGGKGNDLLVGGKGNDAMFGGAGNDTFAVDAVGDTITEIAGEGTDTVNLYTLTAYTLQTDLENLHSFVSAASTLTGNEHSNGIIGNRGNDVLYGLDGNDRLNGAGGADQIYGGEGSDTLTGAGGRDKLYGDAGSDTLDGGAGSDILDGGTGADMMTGGTGNDVYIVNMFEDGMIELADGGYDIARSTAAITVLGAHVEELVGLLNTGQSLSGNMQDNTIVAGSGNDLLDGGGGADIMRGGAGNDSYWVDSVGDSVVEGSNAGTDRVYTGLVSYTLSANVEELIGGGGIAQTLTGNELANLVQGGMYDDVLFGLAGNDLLIGGEGHDELDGGTGNDRMEGGNGDDTYYVDSTADVVVELNGESGGLDAVATELSSYTLGVNVEGLVGMSSTGQTLQGNSAANIIIGGTGNDAIYGFAGDDWLFGDEGNDTLYAGTGADLLGGEAGADRFVFVNGELSGDPYLVDIIADFNRAEGDRIDLSGIDARSNVAGDQAFTFIGTSAFTGVAGQMAYALIDTGGVLMMDTNGDRSPDLLLYCEGVFSFQASDFFL